MLDVASAYTFTFVPALPLSVTASADEDRGSNAKAGSAFTRTVCPPPVPKRRCWFAVASSELLSLISGLFATASIAGGVTNVRPLAFVSVSPPVNVMTMSPVPAAQVAGVFTESVVALVTT